VGSISKKLRGLNAKNRAYLELLLNGVDCGLISKKLRALKQNCMTEAVSSNLGRWI
jgi:hypothetical protein